MQYLRRFLIILLALLFCLSKLACINNSKDEQVDLEISKNTESELNVEIEISDEIDKDYYSVGETVEIDSISISVNSVRRDSVLFKNKNRRLYNQIFLGKLVVPNNDVIFTEASDANEFVIIDLTIRNNSRLGSYSWMPLFNTEVVDSNGGKFAPDLLAGLYLDNSMSLDDILPLGMSSGEIVFQVPKEQSVNFVYYFGDWVAEDFGELKITFNLEREL